MILWFIGNRFPGFFPCKKYARLGFSYCKIHFCKLSFFTEIDHITQFFSFFSATWAEEKFKTETLPNAMKNFAKLLLGNGGKYFVGDDLTWADIRYRIK